MTLENALEIAKREKYGFDLDALDKTITVEEAIPVITEAIKLCWFNWITGQEALKTLKANQQ